MLTERSRILIDSIRRLLRRNADSHLRKIVNKTHAADMSRVFAAIPVPDQRRLFDMIQDIEQKGLLLIKLDDDVLVNFIEDMSVHDIVEILNEMAGDDAADLIGKMPEEKSAAVLDKMKKEESEDIEGLLKYGKDTAGGIMVTDFIAFKEEITARQAIELLQKDYRDVEMPFYLYVVNEAEGLAGVISLRQLVVVAPDTPLKNFMTTDVFSVQTDMDQEEVAKIVARYDILAVPVVDNEHHLVGIVTVDDVIDILRKEATEDFLKMAGAGEEFVETKSVFKSTRIRLPWLFISCVGGIVAFFIISGFEESLSQFTYLASFIPVIMGMGGNIGTQSSTIVVRGLATGLLNVRDIWNVVLKEFAVGLILGLVYGVLVAVVAQMRSSLIAIAMTTGIALLCSMSTAALVGSLMPMVFARIHVDPAVATGPFVTTSIDIISVFCYFRIATLLLGI